ncbi:hypothetical protein BDV09DRAFT_171287 [Aspergillus tetrazonus]
MVRCDQICNRKMSCKHICETPCATTHPAIGIVRKVHMPKSLLMNNSNSAQRRIKGSRRWQYTRQQTARCNQEVPGVCEWGIEGAMTQFSSNWQSCNGGERSWNEPFIL